MVLVCVARGVVRRDELGQVGRIIGGIMRQITRRTPYVDHPV